MTAEQEWAALKKAASVLGTNTGHGHVWDRPDGVRMRCGGPGMCAICAKDAAILLPLANPSTILALEAEHRRLRAENERLRTALSRLLDWPNNFGGGERSDAVAFARAALAQEGE